MYLTSIYNNYLIGTLGLPGRILALHNKVALLLIVGHYQTILDHGQASWQIAPQEKLCAKSV